MLPGCKLLAVPKSKSRKRKRKRDASESPSPDSSLKSSIFFPEQKMFDAREANACLNYSTKLAALKVSASVVSLVSYSGKKEIFQCSGTIIESDSKSAIVLTSAHILRCPSGSYSVARDIKISVHLSDTESYEGHIVAYDFHYHLATIKIHPTTQATPATVVYINDSRAVDSNQIRNLDGKTFRLQRHSNTFSLVHGDPVTAIGRYFIKPYSVMAAPGEFSPEEATFKFNELFIATCQITRCGIGGPLVNFFGDVIGICFYDLTSVKFMPMNVALTWWEHFKKYREVRRPWLGMELGSLYTGALEYLEMMARKFPNISEGVFVDKVIPGSSADAAGVESCDVIIQFGGKAVGSLLELLKESWNRVGETVEVIVLRKSRDVPVHFTMMVEEAAPDQFYKWELWDHMT